MNKKSKENIILNEFKNTREVITSYSPKEEPSEEYKQEYIDRIKKIEKGTPQLLKDLDELFD
ncbi:MAG: hypothetical protein MJ203_03235 [archaeon]|nr:hypothetical protein [archaeon]